MIKSSVTAQVKTYFLGSSQASTYDVNSKRSFSQTLSNQRPFSIREVLQKHNSTDGTGQHLDNQGQATLVKGSDLWHDVKRRYITNSSCTNALNNNGENPESSNKIEKFTLSANVPGIAVFPVRGPSSSTTASQNMNTVEHALPTESGQHVRANRSPRLMDVATQGALEAGKPVGGLKIGKDANEWTSTNYHPYLPSHSYLTCRFLFASSGQIGWDLNMFVRGSGSGQTYGEFFKPCAYLAETTAAHGAPTLSHRSSNRGVLAVTWDLPLIFASSLRPSVVSHSINDVSFYYHLSSVIYYAMYKRPTEQRKSAQSGKWATSFSTSCPLLRLGASYFASGSTILLL
ncbi:hypothetical protein Tco_0621771 [Tanacetum coccineum]